MDTLKLAQIYEKEGAWEKAFELYSQEVIVARSKRNAVQYTRNPQALWGMANVCKTLGYYKEAIKFYGLVLNTTKEEERLAELQICRARTYQQWAKRLPWWRLDRIIMKIVAKRIMSAIEKKHYEAARLLYMIATYYASKGDYAAVAEYLEPALKKDRSLIDWMAIGGWDNFIKSEEWQMICKKLKKEMNKWHK
jgi:tetratricopeptide (TPR) repeat protein